MRTEIRSSAIADESLAKPAHISSSMQGNVRTLLIACPGESAVRYSSGAIVLIQPWWRRVLVDELDSERKRSLNLERDLGKRDAVDLLGKVAQIDGVNVVVAKVEAPNVETMREMGDFLKSKLSSVVVVLASVMGDKPLFVTMVTQDLVAKGFHAGRIAKDVASVTGGGGGGRPELAQAGGKDKSKIELALKSVPKII